MVKLKYDFKDPYFNYLTSQNDTFILLIILSPYIVIGAQKFVIGGHNIVIHNITSVWVVSNNILITGNKLLDVSHKSLHFN